MAGENLLVIDDSPTILKVVEFALTRAGYRVDAALDVTLGLALARSRRPAVILVDSLIRSEDELTEVARAATSPHAASSASTGKGGPAAAKDEGPRGGAMLCGALAADPALAHTPVVLMTGKGEDLEGRYAQSPNVVDYITKPFSPDAVLAVVTHVIEKAGAGTQPAAMRATGEASAPGVRGAVAEALSQSMAPERADALKRMRELLADRLELYRQESGAWELPAIARGALADGALAALLTEAGFEAVEGTSEGPDLSGKLGAISMSEVLTLLGQQAQTGSLRVLTAGARVDLFFRKGRIEFAAAVGVADEFLLGRFAVEAGDISPDDLAQVLKERAQESTRPPLFGRDLVARGLLTPDRLKSAMRRQTAELVYETLRWARGSFQFKRTDDLPALANEASLGITVDTLLLEGFRRVDEWRLIERDVQNFDLVFVRADDRIADLPRGTLTRDEIAVLDALTGKSSVRDIVRSLRMGSFDVSKILYRLLRTKLIRRRIQPTSAS